MAKTILLAEDSEYDERLFRLVLKKSRVENPIIVVRDGAAAISCLEGTGQFANAPANKRPKILCLDLKLDGIDGFTVLEWLGKNPSIKEELLIIVVTAYGNERNHKRAKLLGVRAILSKPLRQAEMENVISEFPNFWIHPKNRDKEKM